MTNEVLFDDLEQLSALVGAPGPWGPQLLVTQPMIDAFAELTGDHQWIHVDPQRAADGPFGTTIAHGFLVLSLLPRLSPPDTFVITGESSRVNYGSDGYRFTGPVPAGSTIRARSTLSEVREHRAGTLVVRETVVHVVDADRPALVFTGLVLFRR